MKPNLEFKSESKSESLHPIAAEFKRIYQPRLIFGQLISYATITLCAAQRVALDQIGISQSNILWCIILGWCIALLYGLVFSERYFNFGRGDSRYTEVESLHKHYYRRYAFPALFTVFAPLIVYGGTQTMMLRDLRIAVDVERSDQIQRRDVEIDYYFVDEVNVHVGGFQWFWTRETVKGATDAVNVTGIIELDRRDDGQSAYLYSRVHRVKTGSVSRDQLLETRDLLQRRLKRDLTGASVFQYKCLMRLRASKERERHLEAMQEAWGSYKPAHTLVLQEVYEQRCDPPASISEIVWKYTAIYGSLFIALIYLMRVMVRAQHNMALCIEAHEAQA